MTLDEAKKVADLISQADSGCPQCVSHLVGEVQQIFPEFQWTYRDYEEVEVTNDQK